MFKLARHCHSRTDADALFAEWCKLVETGQSQARLRTLWTVARTNVKSPPRIDLDAVMDKVYADGIPAWIMQRLPEDTELQAALAFLEKLAATVYPSETWFISTRDLGRLLDMSHTLASHVLRTLCQKQLIELVERGGPDTNKASRYRFVKPEAMPL
jgi:hypothetical protein